MNGGESTRLLETRNDTGSLPHVSRSRSVHSNISTIVTKAFFRSSRSKTTLNEIKRSIFGNMELGLVDFIFASVFIINTVSFISKMLRIGSTFQ